MRHGLTMIVPGLVLAVSLIGAGPDGGASDPPDFLDDRFGTRVAPIWLLMRRDVQADLQLDQGQIASARDRLGQLIERLLNLKNKKGPEVDLERRAIDEDMAAWFSKSLSEPQLFRLSQIDLQWEGAGALHRMSVAAHLDLSEPQYATIDRLLKTERDRRRAGGSLTPVESANFSRQMLAVLTPAQKAQWQKLLGPPCQFKIGRPAAPRNAAG